jgi:hypothetical protein
MMKEGECCVQHKIRSHIVPKKTSVEDKAPVKKITPKKASVDEEFKKSKRQ